MASHPKRVAVIGGGAAGLTAVKCCLDEGLEPTCFEKSENIGGLWHYTEKPKQDQASIYNSTTTNGSKIFFCYSDFPLPDEWPNFLPHFKVREYLDMYATHFQLHPFIKIQHDVISVNMADNYAQTGQWKVKVRDHVTGNVSEDVFDAVMVCAGLHRNPKIPPFPGLSSFKGQIFHSHDYKSPDKFLGKKVVVVGFGDCAIEAAVDISRFNKKVYVSTRHGNWVIPRIGPKGLPYDLMMYNRSENFWNGFRSIDKFNDQIEGFCSERLDHEAYNIKPPWRYLQTQPLINDELPSRVLAGYIELKPDILEIMPTGLKFKDGTVLEDVDALFMGTGYETSFPFVDPRVDLKMGSHFNLYKWMFHPDLKPSSFAMIGCVRVIGGHFPTFELQSRLASRVFKGLVAIPSTVVLKEEISKQQLEQDATFLGNPRHHVTLGWLKYNDELADMIGCKPNLLYMMFKDPQLARQCWYSPCVPAQYRLNGPGVWEGARQVIMNIQNTLLTPLKTRSMTTKDNFN